MSCDSVERINERLEMAQSDIENPRREGDIANAIGQCIEAIDSLNRRTAHLDTPPPAPSDDVYRVECKWVDGPPESPADRDTYLCDRGFGNEFLTVYYTGYGPVFCRHGLVCTPQGILKHAGPLPTGGE